MPPRNEVRNASGKSLRQQVADAKGELDRKKTSDAARHLQSLRKKVVRADTTLTAPVLADPIVPQSTPRYLGRFGKPDAPLLKGAPHSNLADDLVARAGHAVASGVGRGLLGSIPGVAMTKANDVTGGAYGRLLATQTEKLAVLSGQAASAVAGPRLTEAQARAMTVPTDWESKGKLTPEFHSDAVDKAVANGYNRKDAEASDGVDLVSMVRYPHQNGVLPWVRRFGGGALKLGEVPAGLVALGPALARDPAGTVAAAAKASTAKLPAIGDRRFVDNLNEDPFNTLTQFSGAGRLLGTAGRLGRLGAAARAGERVTAETRFGPVDLGPARSNLVDRAKDAIKKAAIEGAPQPTNPRLGRFDLQQRAHGKLVQRQSAREGSAPQLDERLAADRVVRAANKLPAGRDEALLQTHVAGVTPEQRLATLDRFIEGQRRGERVQNPDGTESFQMGGDLMGVGAKHLTRHRNLVAGVGELTPEDQVFIDAAKAYSDLSTRNEVALGRIGPLGAAHGRLRALVQAQHGTPEAQRVEAARVAHGNYQDPKYVEALKARDAVEAAKLKLEVKTEANAPVAARAKLKAAYDRAVTRAQASETAWNHAQREIADVQGAPIDPAVRAFQDTPIGRRLANKVATKEAAIDAPHLVHRKGSQGSGPTAEERLLEVNARDRDVEIRTAKREYASALGAFRRTYGSGHYVPMRRFEQATEVPARVMGAAGLRPTSRFARGHRDTGQLAHEGAYTQTAADLLRTGKVSANTLARATRISSILHSTGTIAGDGVKLARDLLPAGTKPADYVAVDARNLMAEFRADGSLERARWLTEDAPGRTGQAQTWGPDSVVPKDKVLIPRGVFKRLQDEMVAALDTGRKSELGKGMTIYRKLTLGTMPRTWINQTLGSQAGLDLIAGAGVRAQADAAWLMRQHPDAIPTEITHQGPSVLAGSTAGGPQLKNTLDDAAMSIKEAARRNINFNLRTTRMSEDHAAVSVWLKGAGKFAHQKAGIEWKGRIDRQNEVVVRTLRELATGKHVQADDFVKQTRRFFASFNPSSKVDRALINTTMFHRWVGHTIHLVAYDLPVNMPGRTLILEELGRLGEEYRKEHGFLPSFLRGVIPLGGAFDLVLGGPQGGQRFGLGLGTAGLNPLAGGGALFPSETEGQNPTQQLLSAAGPVPRFFFELATGKKLGVGTTFKDQYGEDAKPFTRDLALARLMALQPGIIQTALHQTDAADTSHAIPGTPWGFQPKFHKVPGTGLEQPKAYRTPQLSWIDYFLSHFAGAPLSYQPTQGIVQSHGVQYANDQAIRGVKSDATSAQTHAEIDANRNR